jgi:hypothetical protein
LLNQVQPDVKKIAVWTQNGHKAEDGDHLASVSLKQEGGIGRLVITIGDDGAPVAGHPGFGKEEEDEEGDSDDDGSDSISGSGSEGSGSDSESDAPRGGDERSDSKDPSGKKETEGATSGATAKTPPKKKEAGLPQKKRARAAEAPQSQEREEGPSTERTNPPLKSRNSPPGGAKQGS